MSFYILGLFLKKMLTNKFICDKLVSDLFKGKKYKN